MNMKNSYEHKPFDFDEKLMRLAAEAIIFEEVDKYDRAKEEYALILFPKSLEKDTRWIEKQLKKTLWSAKIKKISPKYAKRVAVLILVFIICGGLLFTVNDSIRAQVLSFIQGNANYKSAYYDVKGDMNALSVESNFPIQAGFVPEGYNLTLESNKQLRFETGNEKYEYILFKTLKSFDASGVDYDKLEIEKTKINDIEYEVCYKKSKGGYYVFWQDHHILFMIDAPRLEKTDILQIVENLYWFGEGKNLDDEDDKNMANTIGGNPEPENVDAEQNIIEPEADNKTELVTEIEGGFALTANYIPQDYILVKENSLFLVYQNDLSQNITVRYLQPTETIYSIVGNVEPERISVKGHIVEIYINGQSYYAFWRENGSVFCVSANGISKVSFKKFVENLN